MLSSTPTSHFKKRPRQESNLVYDLRKVACESGTLQGQERIRADDWICTSMSRFTRAVPFSVEPRRREESRELSLEI